jgi:hypothetical protein
MLEVIEIPCGCGQHPLTFLAMPATPAIQTPYIPPSPALRRIYEQGLKGAAHIALHRQFTRGALGGAS